MLSLFSASSASSFAFPWASIIGSGSSTISSLSFCICASRSGVAALAASSLETISSRSDSAFDMAFFRVDSSSLSFFSSSSRIA